MNLSVDSFPHTDDHFAEEMRNCTQSPADRVLINVICDANVGLHFDEEMVERFERYESVKPVMIGALNYGLTNETFMGKLIQSIGREMEDKLQAGKQWNCAYCVSGRSAAVQTSSMISGSVIPSSITGGNGFVLPSSITGNNFMSSVLVVYIMTFPLCLDPLCLIRVNDARNRMAEAMHGKKIAGKLMEHCICGKVETPSIPFERCSRCQTVFYCSRECQRADWTKFGHKQACRAFVASKKQA
jgi:hypothetical protein